MNKSTLLFGSFLSLFIFICFPSLRSQAQGLTASQNISDSKIQLNWNMSVVAAHRAHNPEVYIQVRNVNTNKEVYSEILDSINNYTIISGSKEVWVEPSSSNQYQLRILEYGPGTVLHSSATVLGTTLAFQAPGFSIKSGTPWEVELNTLSISDYDTKLYVLRDDSLVAILPQSQSVFKETCDPKNPNSIINGQSYTYKLISVNDIEGDSIFSQSTFSLSTAPVGFSATQNIYPDKIKLTWNNISPYVTQLEIVRDGVSIAILNDNTTSFEDLTPIPGHVHSYELKLYVNEEVQLTLPTKGSIPANGLIEGYVINQSSTGDFAVPNVMVKATGTVNGIPVTLSTQTDANGHYSFGSVAYYRQTDFTLTANTALGKINNNNQTISLAQNNPIGQIDFEADVPSFELSAANFTLNTFEAKAVDSLGQTDLNWEIIATDTVYYYLYRGDKLIKRGYQTSSKGSFTDLEGIPSVNYAYSIRLYSRTFNTSSQKFDYFFVDGNTSKIQFPAPFAIPSTGFTVTSSTSDATVKISWQHPEGNIEGYNVFRDAKLIATLDKSTKNFTDLSGTNGKSYIYAISAYRKLNDTLSFNSAKLFSTSTLYPSLLTPSNLSVSDGPQGFPTLSWVFNVSGSYNYDGFYVFREGDTLAFVRKSLPFSYTDGSGIPGKNYRYRVQTVKKTNPSASAPSSWFNKKYPELPRLKYTFASTGNREGLVYFNYEVDSAYSYLDVSISNKERTAYFAHRKPSTFGTVIPVNDYAAGSRTYAMTLSKVVDGVRYYGTDTTQVHVNFTTSAPYNLDTVANLSASTTYSSHVKLCWDYPDYLIPRFEIYRDGFLLETIEGVHKTYFDHTVYDNQPHLYQVQVRLNGEKSRRKGVLGQRAGNGRIYGTAFTEQGKQGIPNTDIYLYLPDSDNEAFVFLSQTKTDQTGYYEFLNVPMHNLDDGYSEFRVSAGHPNAAFRNKNVDHFYYDSIKAYTANFIDTLPNNTPTADTIAQVVNLIAISNEENHTVDIRWQASNANYTSFEVYRGLALLATIQGNQTKLAIDDSGVPGYEYSYRVRPIWQKDALTKVEGEYKTVIQQFPVIYPVENLLASILKDAVQINWSHKTDLSTDYLVYRNGDLLWKVKSGDPLEILDTLGKAGTVYKYSVVPVLSSDNNISGIELSTIAVFPRVSMVENLSSTGVANGRRLRWVNNSLRAQHFLVYCNGRLVDTVFSTAKNVSALSYEGIPNANNVFSVSAAYWHQGVLYSGKKVSINAFHGTLTTPSIATSDKGTHVELTGYSYFNGGESGIEFYDDLNDETLGIIAFKNKNLPFTYMLDHITGLPGTTYQYRCRIYSIRNGITYYSNYSSALNRTFPNLPAPTQVVAVDSNGFYRVISWKYHREDVSIRIFRYGITGPIALPDAPGNTKLLRDADRVTDAQVHYGVQAILTKGGNIYPSDITLSNDVYGQGKGILASGANQGRFGNGSTTTQPSFVLAIEDENWVKLATGRDHTLGIKSDGTLWVWGNSTYGQLGLGASVTSSNTPLQLGTDNTWVHISCTERSSYGIKSDGSLWAWGRNNFGQLGTGNTATQRVPVQIGTGSKWKFADGGRYSVLFIKEDGSLWGCGYNLDGQLGPSNMLTAVRNIQRVGSASNWMKVSVGYRSCMGITTSGQLWAWGYNGLGQLGKGNNTNYTSPTRIGSATNWKDCHMAWDHCWARNTSNRLSYAGDNSNGYIGYGSTSTMTAISGTYNQPFFANHRNSFITFFDRLFVTGEGVSGKLGYGSYTNATGYTLVTTPPSFNIDDIESNQFHTLLLASTNVVNSFTATDGTLGTKVRLEWSDLSGISDAKSIELYRDGELISIEKMTATDYTDLDAVPGMKHAYSIGIKKNNGAYLRGRSDIGWRKPAGVVKGNVLSLVGNQPVPDVDIQLKVVTEDGNYYYSTKSDNNGDFRFDEVYYGRLGQAIVSASYPGHEFVQDTLKAALDLTITSLGIGTFIDKTANLIRGVVSRRNSDCPIDSVPVTLIKHYNNSADVEELKYTTADGSYAFSVNPFEQDLASFELRLASFNVLSGDTVLYKWNQNNIIVDKSIVGINTPAQDFVDLMSVPYQFSVNNACDVYPGTRFTLDVRSIDGCFDKTLVSNDNGVFPFQDLPPLQYIVSVSGATPLTANIIPVVEYLSLRPLSLDLSKHNLNRTGDSTFQNLFFEKGSFTYHNIPDITLTRGSGMSNIVCNPNVLLVKGKGDPQAADASCTFNVRETHNGTTCDVEEGFLIIKNSASSQGDLRIDYDPVAGAFPEYTFKPGLPETVAPYFKVLTVEYHNKFGFVSQAVYQILVTGKAPQPGSDVIIDSEQGKDFQIPLAVLRDPPGDNSYSYLEKGVESTKTFSVSRSFGGSVSLSGSTGLGIFGVGIEVEASASTGGADGNTDELTITHSTTQRFETSAESDIQNSSGSEYLVGDNADLIIGTGMALKYGIIESLTYNVDSCKVYKTTEVGISPDKLTTTWAFTVAHIENQIAEYENLLQLAKAGRVTIQDNSGGSEPRDTSFYRTLIANWQGVLNYHRNNTLPHYNLCDRAIFDRDFKVSKIEAISQGKAKEIRETAKSFTEDCFCSNAGSWNQNDQFTLNPDFKWTDNLLLKYRIARSRREELLSYFTRLENKLVIGNGYTPPSLDKYNDDDSKWEKELSESDKSYAENITFSANASVEKTFSKSETNTHTYTQQIYGDASLYAGILIVSELDVSTWAGIGAGVNVKANAAVDIETRAGIEATFDFDIENQAAQGTTTTTTSGYVLGDDDAGDQFSVTAIKGIEQMHTPYFELFAGRSSCPYEPGTIPRDRPEIQLEYPDGTAFPNNVLRDLKPDVGGYYALKIVNKAPEIFNEYRYYNIVQAANSNQNGALLRAAGSGSSYPVTYKVLSGGSTYTGMTLHKTGNFYDYSDIRLQAIPTCLDASSDLTDGFNGAEIALEAYFRRECSDISILSPGDNWRLIKARNALGQPSEQITIQIGDYDPENPLLESITMQYRRIGTNTWTDMVNSTITKDSLQRYFQLFRTVYRDPVYNFVWDVLGKDGIIDGTYEIRAYANCGIEGKIYSNISTGVIDRTALTLYGVPKPTDGILNIGEKVEVIFSEPIECGFETKANRHYRFTRKSDGLELAFSPLCQGNSIVYNFDGDLDTLDNEVILMEVFDVEDLNGNKLTDTVNHEFMIRNTPVSWQPYSLEIDVYKGESKLSFLGLVNTGAAKANASLSKIGTPGGLLSLELVNDSIFPNSTLQVPIRVNAQTQDIGTYNFTVSADISTFAKNYGIIDIPVKVNVLPVPPQWIVPSGKSMSTVVVCNFELDGLRSTDTMDRIAIAIGNEVRGFDNIYKSKAGNNLYYAVINVQGNASDIGKEFKYRIWDASSGAEYDGSISGGAITFDGGIYGTTSNPRIIEVNSGKDSVRYIPLIKGWNWLAFNYKKDQMDLAAMLTDLNLTGGEIIKTLSKQAVYDDSLSTWFSLSTGLTDINTQNGYHLFLNRDDILRVSGSNADFKPILIQQGWNLIGNPHQRNQPINQVFTTNPDIVEGAILKTGGQLSKAAVLEGGSWTGSITEYETNQSYMLFNGKSTSLVFRNDDCNSLKPESFQYNMTILGSVQFNWNEHQEEGDYVVAMIGSVCRGKGVIEEVNTPSRRYMLNMFIYGDSADLGKEVTFKLYRQSTDQFHDLYTKDSWTFVADYHIGMANDPYWFSNDQNFVNIKDVKQMESIMHLSIYPNPFTTNLSVKLKSEKSGLAKIVLYDLQGKIMHTASHHCSEGLNQFKVNPKSLAAGVYMVQITLNGKTSITKILKE